MKITTAIAQQLLDVHFSENWTDVWIRQTIEDTGLEEAIQQRPASVNTTAALLHHITFYNRVILERLKGKDPVIPETNGFDLPPLRSEADWTGLKEANFSFSQGTGCGHKGTT